MEKTFLQSNLLLDAIVKSFEPIEIDGQQVIWWDQLLGVLDNMKRAIQFNDASAFSLERGLKVSKVVDIEEFIESSDYLDLKKDIRPAVKRELIRCFDSGEYYIEICCTGAIGIGKGFFGIGGLLHNLYINSCLWNPQAEYNLPLGSSIYYIIQSKTANLAKRSVFNELKERVKNSKYFNQHFMFDKKASKAELQFPNNFYITPFGGSDTAALGLQVMGAIIDEVNDMIIVEDSALTRFTGGGEYNQAERIYNTILRRMTSRFQVYGVVPGKLYLLGSSKYPGDFTDRKMAEEKEQRAATGKSTIFVMKMSQWESIPSSKYSGRVFLVELGNDYKQSRIIDCIESARDQEDVREVPEEYLPDFERDIEGAVRDIIGEATASKSVYLSREKIVKAQEHYKEVYGEAGIFWSESAILSYEYDPDPNFSEITNLGFFDSCSNIIDPENTRFFAHLDVGLGEDKAGLTLGFIGGYKLLPVTRYWNDRAQAFIELTDMRAPVYHHIGSCQLRGYRGSQVDLNLVRDLIVWLKQYMNIYWFTLDSYQHVMFLQAMKRLKIKAATLSVDATLGPYSELKMALNEERVLLKGEWLAKELRELEKDGDNKVDHPQKGSKDIADSVAGVSYMLLHKEANLGRANSGRRAVRRGRNQNVTEHAIPEASGGRRGRRSGRNRRLRFA